MKSATILLMLLSVTLAMRIDCDYNVQASYGYGCNATLTKPLKQEVKLICGEHQPGKSDRDVKFFMANDNQTTAFPDGLANKFPNIETINVNFPNLDRLCNEDLKQFGSKLKNLILAKNEIDHIPKNLFESTPNITYLYIESNNIKSIHKDAFKPLGNLRNFFAKFASDKCSENDDATTRSDVETLIANMQTSCYDPKFIEPACKRSSIDYYNDEDVGVCQSTPPPTSTSMEPITSSPAGPTSAAPEPEPSGNAWIVALAIVVVIAVIKE